MSDHATFGWDTNKREISRMIYTEHGTSRVTVAATDSYRHESIQVELTPNEARELAADLMRRADAVEEPKEKAS